MALPTDRLLIMIIVVTGFAVLIGGWAGGLVHGEATGLSQLGLRLALGIVFVAVILGAWFRFSRVDEEKS